MIRGKIYTDIIEEIDTHDHLSITDFIIDTKGKYILIKYEHDENYFFKVDVPNSTTTKTRTRKENQFIRTKIIETETEEEVYKFRGTMSPGEIAVKENISFEGHYELLRKIRSWLNCLWEEILAIPINREIEKQNEVIEEIKSKINNISDDYFSKEEGEDLKNKLDSLEKKLTEQFQKQLKDEKELNKKVKELNKEIESLKATIFSLNKKSWFKSSISRIYHWISKGKNRKLLSDGAKLLKPILPENIRDIIE